MVTIESEYWQTPGCLHVDATRHPRRHHMRTSLVAASLSAAVAALAAGVSPGTAQSAAQLYPYCAFRSGSTSCYHLTVESCGHSCIRNPGYVGDERARVLRAALGAPALAGDRNRTTSRASGSRTAANRPKSIDALAPGIDAGARASSSAGADFAGYPTSYLINRFGDRQAQGRY
jgi:hypothetical protein